MVEWFSSIFFRFCLRFFCPLLIFVCIFIVNFAAAAYGLRSKRQSDETSTKKDETFEQELCKGKDAGEWFRLVSGDGDNCRDVIQCTSSVSLELINNYALFFAVVIFTIVRKCNTTKSRLHQTAKRKKQNKTKQTN